MSSFADFAIISRSLADITRRLETAPKTPLIQQLEARALGFRRVFEGWEREPSTSSESARGAMLRDVLEMQIALMNGAVRDVP